MVKVPAMHSPTPQSFAIPECLFTFTFSVLLLQMRPRALLVFSQPSSYENSYQQQRKSHLNITAKMKVVTGMEFIAADARAAEV